MKKVLFVISYLGKGGAERALSNITTHFPADWDIDILINEDRGSDYPFRGKILTLGFTEKPKMDSIIFQFKVFLRRILKLRRLKKEGNYQACISFLDSANIANILSGKRYCKVIVSVRNSLVQSAKTPQYKYIVNPLVKILYNWSDNVIAVSDGVRWELIEHFNLKEKKVIAIENGYDLKSIGRQAELCLDKDIAELLSKYKTVITTGRLADQKGHWHLIRAFSDVIKQVPDALLVIMGTGKLEAYLKELVVKCGLEDKVIFTGHVSNPYQYEKYGDIFVLSSLYEGFPNALAEAVCLGMPCIATDFRTGAREILAPDMDAQGEGVRKVTEVGYGVITPLCSGKKYSSLEEPLEYQERCLADAMTMLLTNEEKKREYIDKSKQRRNDLTIDAVVKKWVDLISC